MRASVGKLHRFTALEAAVFVGAAVLAALAGAIIVAFPEWARQASVVGIAGAMTAAPVLVRTAQRRLDPFEPLVIMSIAAFVLFFVRPVWMWVSNKWTLGPYDLRTDLTGTEAVVIVGFAGLVAGYAVPAGRRVAARLPSVPDGWDPGRLLLACGVVLVLAAVLFANFIGSHDLVGTVKNYFSGRSTDLFNTLTRQGSTSGYFYLAPYVAIPIALILVENGTRFRSRVSLAMAAVVAVIVLLMTVPRGDRGLMLTLILPLIVLYYTRRGRRPRALAIVALLVVGMLVFTALINFRAKATRTTSLPDAIGHTLSSPLKGVDDFMLGPDVSMISILGAQYENMPRLLDYRPGGTLFSTIAEPVPRAVWPNKPTVPQFDVFAALFPANAAQTKGGFTSSMFGDFYADSGFIGSLLYGFLIGFVMRLTWEYWRQRQDNRGVTLLFAAILPMFVILMRANLSATFGFSIVLIAPIPLILWWASRGRVRAPALASR